jgi:hypothetical protein
MRGVACPLPRAAPALPCAAGGKRKSLWMHREMCWKAVGCGGGRLRRGTLVGLQHGAGAAIRLRRGVRLWLRGKVQPGAGLHLSVESWARGRPW